MDLQRISDELEITALLNRYARAVDTKDWDLYRSVFTDDAHMDYSPAGAIAGSRQQVADWLAQGIAAIPMSMQFHDSEAAVYGRGDPCGDVENSSPPQDALEVMRPQGAWVRHSRAASVDVVDNPTAASLVHGTLSTRLRGSPRSRARSVSSMRSRRRALCSRDITVPMGMSMISAISL